jgi:hypothetical protein
MRQTVAAITCAMLVAAFGSHTPGIDAQSAHETQRRMSFHNRLLLNRAVLAGLRSIEVLLLVKDATGGFDAATASTALTNAIANLGGRVLRTEAAIGYLRIEVPPERLVELVANTAIEAYQISSLSRGAWYRDGPPVANAEMFRGFEVDPIKPSEPTTDYSHLAALTPAEARAPGFTADNDVGVGDWMKEHPTFDGRGVTIAVLETGQPSFADPVFRTAKTLDGRDVPKIAGILNAIDRESRDETRVRLTSRLDAPRSWARVGQRTYVMPSPGTYWIGTLDVPAGANAVHQFAVVESERSGEIWIDANGDASFQDEKPLADVNERFEPRSLTITYPSKVEVSFVMSRGSEPHVAHIYLGTSDHQSMTGSVAAGNRSDQSLASGVAPNARLLFVRMHGSEYGVANLLEGFIETAKRADADVLTASMGLSFVPETGTAFVGLLFSRLITTYRKPIVTGAGNFGLMLGHVHGHGGALSAGGTLGPETYAALHGGRSFPQMIVHHMSAAGPSLDGAVEPDVLAPMERIAAAPAWFTDMEAAPHNAPTRRIPSGYQISCCTSASSPYAAGVIALLISAARQSNIPYSAESLTRAMRVTARPVAGYQAHQQGNGALDINAAWRELTRRFEPPRISATARIVHPLALYAGRGPHGSGILEFEGWTAGAKGIREIQLRRESGPREPTMYALRWSADDGTFTTRPTVTLPLGETITVPVTIDVKTPGAHSGLLTLHDPMSGNVVFRTQATIVASAEFDAASGSLEVKSSLGLLQQNAHYIHVPSGARALALELEITRGVLHASLVQAHGLTSNYYMSVHPMDVFSVGPGKYHTLMPNPDAGTWTVRLRNSSKSFPANLGMGPRGDADVEYVLRARVLRGAIRPQPAANGRVALEVVNDGSAMAEPVIEAWPATLRSHRAAFNTNGLSNLVEIDVPADAAALSLQLRADTKHTNVELFLYDCTTGECFSYDVAFPAAPAHTLMVRKPAPGHWVAAVNTAPFPTAAGSFVLDEVITSGTPARRTLSASLHLGARVREVFDSLPGLPTPRDKMPIVFFELLDAAAERLEAEQPWNAHPRFVKLRDRPVALATAVYQP